VIYRCDFTRASGIGLPSNASQSRLPMARSCGFMSEGEAWEIYEGRARGGCTKRNYSTQGAGTTCEDCWRAHKTHRQHAYGARLHEERMRDGQRAIRGGCILADCNGSCVQTQNVQYRALCPSRSTSGAQRRRTNRTASMRSTHAGSDVTEGRVVVEGNGGIGLYR
jgi:hypothetical protein